MKNLISLPTASYFTPLTKSQLLRRTLLVCALIHVAYQAFIWIPAAFACAANGRDVDVYFRAARHLLRHKPLYDLTPGHSPMFDYLYSPQFAVALTPFVRMGQHNFASAQYVLIVLAFWYFAYLLAKISLPKPTLNAVLLWGLALAVSPKVYFCMGMGQVQPLLWVAFALSVISDRWRGVLLGVTLQIKTYALVPLVFAAWKERRMVVVPALLVIVAGIALGLLAGGWTKFWEWRQAIEYVAANSELLRPDNISFSVLALRGFMPAGWTPPAILPVWVSVYLKLMSIAGPLFVWRLCHRMPTQKQFAWVSMAGMVFAPICWAFYLTAGYVLVALYLRDYSQSTLAKVESQESDEQPAIAHS
jgi:hypothetical protein